MAINIQHSWSISRASIESSQSLSPLPMDSSTLSDIDYAERVAMQNNMNINKTAIDDPQSQVLCKESMQSPTPAPIHLCTFSKVVSINMLEQNPFS